MQGRKRSLPLLFNSTSRPSVSLSNRSTPNYKKNCTSLYQLFIFKLNGSIHCSNIINRTSVDLHISSQWWNQRHFQVSMCNVRKWMAIQESIKYLYLNYNTCWWIQSLEERLGSIALANIAEHDPSEIYCQENIQIQNTLSTFFDYFNLIWADRRCNEEAQPIPSC